ncbi:MAG: diadenylate cyclase CdaA [Desulfobacterales bacterium]
MSILAILRHIRFQDILDILFLSIVTYHLYIWFRETKAFRVLVGLLGLGVIFTAARAWGLFLTTWMFQILWQVLIILLIILFQPEIRQVLERFNPLKNLGWPKLPPPPEWADRLAEACFAMACLRIGALLIIERSNRVDELITGGIRLEAPPRSELLFSIFQKESPLHDGAVVVRQGQIVEAACFLPLSAAENLPSELGTRHRAALGISERSDAWTVVVSEERGEVALARAGQLFPMSSAGELSKQLSTAFVATAAPEVSKFQRVRQVVTRRWRVKLGSLALVSALWLLLAGQQDFEVSFRVPLDIYSLPNALEIVEPAKPEIQVTVRGLRKDASTIKPRDIRVRLDLANAAVGTQNYRIFQNLITLPSRQLDVVRIQPAELTLSFEEKGASTAEEAAPDGQTGAPAAQ